MTQEINDPEHIKHRIKDPEPKVLIRILTLELRPGRPTSSQPHISASSQKLVLIAAACFAGEVVTCKELTHMTQLSLTTVKRSLTILERAGVIKQSIKGDGRWITIKI